MDDLNMSKLADVCCLYAAALILSEYAINRDLRRYTVMQVRELLDGLARAVGRFSL